MNEQYISQDQMRKILHISKRKAKYILDNGIIPCINTGKKTRQYRIKLSDIESFILNPYEFEKGMFNRNNNKNKSKNGYCKIDKETLFAFYQELFANEKDVLTIPEVSKMIGYAPKTIYRWIDKNWLNTHLIMNKKYITKKDLFSFVISNEYLSINQKSKKHIEQLQVIKSRCYTTAVQ